MEIQNQSKLSFYGVDIIETSLKIKKPFNFEGQIDLKTEAKLISPTDDGTFKIVMTVRLNFKDYFDIKVGAIGNFKIEGYVSSEEQKSFININAPAIMFPYIRSFISNLSANCGQSLPTLVAPPQFFHGNLKEFNINHSDVSTLL
jgi:preprotein translocase subunit SecB